MRDRKHKFLGVPIARDALLGISTPLMQGSILDQIAQWWRTDWSYRWIRFHSMGVVDRKRIREVSAAGYQVISIAAYPNLQGLSDDREFFVTSGLVLCGKPIALDAEEVASITEAFPPPNYWTVAPGGYESECKLLASHTEPTIAALLPSPYYWSTGVPHEILAHLTGYGEEHPLHQEPLLDPPKGWVTW